MQEPTDGDAWAMVQARQEAFADLHSAGALDDLPCSACGYPTLTERGHHHLCVLCHWEDDDSLPDQPDRPSAANHGLTLRQAAAHFRDTGVFAVPGWSRLYPEFFTPEVRAARAELMALYERLIRDPGDATARQDVRKGRSNLMYAMVMGMR
jgi:hypothetical protein